ncbi:hypothetical protein GJ744_011176 [Endocarpon pusillum]|uniref:DNA damage-binding protein 1 n=1 Tax=Endocarpon pusillum TaxID=364733 RepID=A0A8H7E307_9EURO|nr:hypothetical protein GJ744_011176 [Endocarpon pusillum]
MMTGRQTISVDEIASSKVAGFTACRWTTKHGLPYPLEEALIVTKSNRLEIYAQAIDGLILVHSASVYGYITMLERLRPSTSTTDHLFIGTDRYQYFTVSWDASLKKLRTEQSYLDQADKVLRDSQEADRCHVDPSRRFMTLELYDGVVTVIPLQQATDRGPSAKRQSIAKQEDRGILGSPVQVRIEELAIRSSAFLDVDSSSKTKPRLALLWEDNADTPQLKIRELEYFPDAAGDQASAELKTIAEFRDKLDLGVSHLVPVSAPYGGFLILGERSITYVDSELKTSIPRDLDENATVWVAWEKIDDQRWLLADDYGRLYFMMIMVEGTRVQDWRLDLVGTTSKASALVYLDRGHVFVGSHSGDSQVVKIEEGGLKVAQTFDNIAPILDFTIMDLGRGTEGGQANDFSSGQARLVTASGAWQDGSIRSVRSGVGIEELGSLGEMSHITDMWGLDSTGDSVMQDTLLVTFVDETRIFTFDSEATIEEVDHFHGLELSETTLSASNLSNRRILQVAETSVRIADLDSGMTTSTWRPADGSKITATASNEERLLVVSGGTTLHVFDLSNDLTSISSKSFPTDSQIAGIAIPPAPTSVCVVAFWQSASVAIIEIPSLDSLHTQILGPADTAIPRSVLIANILPDSPPNLFVAMADGTVMTYTMDMSKHTLSNMTRIVLGSEPVTFKKLPRDLSSDSESTLSNIFASCEQPSLIYASEGRMVYSAVNFDKASRVTHFNSGAYPGAIAIATPKELKLALIDAERRTQLHTLPVGETVRCVTYSEGLKMFGMGCIRRMLENGAENGAERLLSRFKVADEVSFKPLDSVELAEEELVECTVVIPVAKDGDSDSLDMFVVGTSMLDESSEQSVKGRILIYEVDKERKLSLMTELGVKGACRSLAICDGKIVAGLVKTVVVYALVPTSIHSHNLHLVKLAAYRTATNPLSLTVTPSTKTSPALIAVADLMKSVSILVLIPPPPNTGLSWALSETARHFAVMWSSSVSVIGDNEWVAADMDGNLIVVRRNVNGVAEDDRKLLEVTSELRLGEIVNSIVPVRMSSENMLTMRARSSSTTADANAVAHLPAGPAVTPQAFLATVEGGVYMLGTISAGYQDVLMRLQQAVSARTKGLGYMPWAKYRAFKNEVREADEPFRFVDGELVEGFLNFSQEDMEGVVAELGAGLGLQAVKGMVEGLRRLH